MSTSYPIDIQNLHISDNGDVISESPTHDDVDWKRLKAYAASLPYSVEPDSKMQGLLDFYLMRIVQVENNVLGLSIHFLTQMNQCIKAKDFEPGLLQWDSMVDQSVLAYFLV